MPNLGMGELFIVLLIVVVLFGANRLPQIGAGIGSAIKNFKRGLQSDDDIDVTPKDRSIPSQSSARPVSEESKETDVTQRKG